MSARAAAAITGVRLSADKDQTVLVGLSLKQATSADIGAPDTFPTPYTLTEGTLTAGVEVQATILDNLRHNLYLLPVPRPVMVLLVIAGAFLAAAFSARGVTWRRVAVTRLMSSCLRSCSSEVFSMAPPAQPPARCTDAHSGGNER